MENSKGWNYDELAEELAWGFIDVNEESFPFLLEEARRRHDGDVVANLASAWFEERDKHSYFELVEEAARLGSSKACFWLGNEYRWGNELPRNFEKAYYYYLQDKDYDWPPIDPEEVLTEEEEGEVTSEWLLSHLVTVEGGVEGESDDIDWWLFVLGKRPTRSLKCGVADWYMKQGGEENRAKALKLFEESANEGFKFAFFKLIEFYSRGEFKDIEKGRYWFYKAAEHGFDEASFADELGVESLKFRKMKEAADKGDCIAAANVACAYLKGEYGDYEDGNYLCCPKDEDKARHYGVLACMDEKAEQILVNLLDDDNREDQRFLNEVAR